MANKKKKKNHTKHYLKQLYDSLAWDWAVQCKTSQCPKMYESERATASWSRNQTSASDVTVSGLLFSCRAAAGTWEPQAHIDDNPTRFSNVAASSRNWTPKFSTSLQCNTVSYPVWFTVGLEPHNYLWKIQPSREVLLPQIQAEPLTWRSGWRLDCRSFHSLWPQVGFEPSSPAWQAADYQDIQSAAKQTEGNNYLS